MKKLTATETLTVPKGEYQFYASVKVAGETMTVEIGGDTHDPPFMAVLAATEHMMTMCAMMSPGKDFDAALELLCDGARSNLIREWKGQQVQ